MASTRRPPFNTLVHCPDSTRSLSGAWLFDGNQDFDALILDLKQEDPSRTTAVCFELLGAFWDATYFEKFELSYVTIDAYCPDASRPVSGAWLLDRRLVSELRVRELKAEDPSRTMADCFQLLGATWGDTSFSSDWLVNRSPSPMVHSRFDPGRTKVERVVRDIPNADGIEESLTGADFMGAWKMTLEQMADANMLKRKNPAWDWWRCNLRAGGQWGYCHLHVLDQEGITAEEAVWERHANLLVV